MAADEAALAADLAGARFQVGVDRGRWRLVTLEWPIAIVAVSAAPRPDGPTEYFLRFDLAGYPVMAPTATPWELEAGCRLADGRRPKGGRSEAVFNPGWQNGQALYLPCDRVASPGHDNWAQLGPEYAWRADRDITFYLRQVHEVLNDDDYQGIQCP